VLPTFALTLAQWAPDAVGSQGGFHTLTAMHGAQQQRLHRELPRAGELAMTATVTGVWDKGAAAVFDIRVDSDYFAPPSDEPTWISEWGADGIRVNAVAPHALSPGLKWWTEANPEEAAEFVKTIPLGRVGDCERDIGRAVAFLVGPDAGYLTGATPVGRAILAFLDPESVDGLLHDRLSNPVSARGRTLSTLHQDLNRIRQRHGVSIDRTSDRPRWFAAAAVAIRGPMVNWPRSVRAPSRARASWIGRCPCSWKPGGGPAASCELTADDSLTVGDVHGPLPGLPRG